MEAELIEATEKECSLILKTFKISINKQSEKRPKFWNMKVEVIIL